MFADQFGQVVGDGDVQLVDGAAAEIGAGGGQLLEVIDWIQAEKVAIHVGVGKIVAGYVGQGREALVDVVILGMFDDLFGDLLLVAEDGFVVVVGGQVAVYHLGVVAYAHL